MSYYLCSQNFIVEMSTEKDRKDLSVFIRTGVMLLIIVTLLAVPIKIVSSKLLKSPR